MGGEMFMTMPSNLSMVMPREKRKRGLLRLDVLLMYYLHIEGDSGAVSLSLVGD